MSADEPSGGARFSFYPAVRSGYRPTGDGGEAAVELTVTGWDDDDERDEKTVRMPIHLYGPGDVTGVDLNQIVRRDPRPSTDDHSPSQFPLIEFERPDLPWLFSPETRGENGRLRPWLMLIAVDRDDPEVGFERKGPGGLPTVEAPIEALPDPADAWAWAHAQQTCHDGADEIPSIEIDSDHSRSRLLAPLHLEAQHRYRACLVPTYEYGRLAALDRDPADADEVEPTTLWSEANSGRVTLPVYDCWTFITAESGDFGTLARELSPVEFGPDLGVRTVDVSKPGPTSLKRPGEGAESTVGLEGALISPAYDESVRGTPDEDGYDEDLQAALETLLDRAEAIDESIAEGIVSPPLYGRWHAGRSSLDADSAHWFDALNRDPRYRIAAGFGTMVVQAEQEALMASAWEQFDELEAINDYLKRCRLAREAQESLYVDAEALRTERLLPLSRPSLSNVIVDDRKLSARRVLEDADAPIGMLDDGFRRLTSPSSSLARREGVSLSQHSFETAFVARSGWNLDESGTADAAVDAEGVADHEVIGDHVTEADRIGSASGAGDASPTVDVAGDDAFEGMLHSTAAPGAEPDSVGEPGAEWESDGAFDEERRDDRAARRRTLALLESVDRHCRSLKRGVSALDAMVGEDGAIEAGARTELGDVRRVARSVRPGTVEPLGRALSKLLIEPRPPTVAPSLTDDAAAAEVDALRGEADRVESLLEDVRSAGTGREPDASIVEGALAETSRTLSRMIETVASIRGSIADETRAAEGTGTDAMAASEGEAGPGAGAGHHSMLMAASADHEAGGAGSIDELREAVLEELDPEARIAETVTARTGLPKEFVCPDKGGPLRDEVMPAPSFDWPMYRELAAIDDEYLLPGVGDIERDSVGLVTTNPRFVEAYLAGLNHEMARLLRWRLYPTDRQGTYFREFWDHDPDPYADETVDAKADVEALTEWDGELGENVTADPPTVFVIRGELFRRYPNTVLYAAKAERDEDEDGRSYRRPQTPPGSIEEESEGIEFPSFDGELGDDVHFFGFDRTIDELVADEGWFFVLEEPPAEHRFGVVGDQYDEKTVEAEPGEVVDLHDGDGDWIGDVLSAVDLGEYDDGDELAYVQRAVDEANDGAGPLTYAAMEPGQTTADDWETDSLNGAHVANVTYRMPTRIAIHATEMLPDEVVDAADETETDPANEGESDDREGLTFETGIDLEAEREGVAYEFDAEEASSTGQGMGSTDPEATDTLDADELSIDDQPTADGDDTTMTETTYTESADVEVTETTATTVEEGAIGENESVDDGADADDDRGGDDRSVFQRRTLSEESTLTASTSELADDETVVDGLEGDDGDPDAVDGDDDSGDGESDESEGDDGDSDESEGNDGGDDE